MGGGGSEAIDIDGILDAQFKINCLASATSIQNIELNHVSFIMGDNCNLTFRNRASVNSSCEMAPIIDAIAEVVVSADEEFAKTLQDAQDRQANAKCEADNCTDKIKVAIAKNLNSACATAAKAQQTLTLNGANIICDGNTVSKFGNYTEVRAHCLRSLLGVEDTVEEVSGQNSENLGSSDNDNNDMMMMLGVLALIAIIILEEI